MIHSDADNDGPRRETLHDWIDGIDGRGVRMRDGRVATSAEKLLRLRRERVLERMGEVNDCVQTAIDPSEIPALAERYVACLEVLLIVLAAEQMATSAGGCGNGRTVA